MGTYNVIFVFIYCKNYINFVLYFLNKYNIKYIIYRYKKYIGYIAYYLIFNNQYINILWLNIILNSSINYRNIRTLTILLLIIKNIVLHHIYVHFNLYL